MPRLRGFRSPLQLSYTRLDILYLDRLAGTIEHAIGGPAPWSRSVSYKSRRWITCVLEFRGRHRIVMSPNRYTELFFLDEAVAFAAGHRPCAECRRERYNAFREAWRCQNKQSNPPFADEIDLALHPVRIDKERNKVTHQAALRLLPDGCFVQIEGSAYPAVRSAEQF